MQDLIGIPYRDHGRDLEGVDCWGLVRLVLARMGRGEIPDYRVHYRSSLEAAECAHAIRTATATPRWRRIEDVPESGDVLVFTCGGVEAHCGIVVDDLWMLHCLRPVGVHRARWRRPPWGRRLSTVWRLV